MNKIATILLIIIVIILIAFWLHAHHVKSIEAKPSSRVPVVTVEPLTYHTSALTVTTYGVTLSPTSVTIRSQQDAIIVKIAFQPGQHVRKKQLLFRLNVSDINSQARKLKAQMLQSKSFYQRLQRMNNHLPGTVAKFDLLKAKSQHEQDLSAYQEISHVENIQAPVSGIITATHLATGDVVSAGQALAIIVSNSTLQVQYQLPSQYAKQSHIDQSIHFYPDGLTQSYIGKVSYVSPQFNEKTYSLTLRADLLKAKMLWPNQFGKLVQTINPKAKVLAIPQKLVHTDAKGFYVYTVKNNKVNKAYFIAGQITSFGLIYIKSGIKAGLLIITSDTSMLNPGEAVKVTIK